MSDRTIRYRAATTIPYARAVVALTEYARTSGLDFEFGPMDLEAMVLSGLAVTGPDLDELARFLNQVPGLLESDELRGR